MKADIIINQRFEMQSEEKLLWQIYEEGDFIDAKDNQAEWLVGYIIIKNHNTNNYQIRFDGWDSKYDQIYKFNSLRLKPFRTIVLGYTGQKTKPAWRKSWKFTTFSHQARVSEFQKKVNSITTLSAHEINQFFRGHNYFYVDFLMTLTFQTLENFKLALNYFKMNVKFISQYLTEIDTSFQSFYYSEENISQGLLKVGKIAYQCSFFEIIDTLYIIQGGYMRLLGFFQKNNAHIKSLLQIADSKNCKKQYQIMIYKLFSQCKGFFALNNIIHEKLSKTKVLIPFVFLYAIVHLYTIFKTHLQLDCLEKTVDKLINIINDNMKKLDISYLKNFNNKYLSDLMRVMQTLGLGTKYQTKVKQWCIKTELQACLLMIESPYFEKKIKGIHGIILMSNNHQEIIKDGRLVQWIHKIKLLDTLFTHNDNVEVIKKAAELCRILYEFRSLCLDQCIKTIWNSRIGKHEAAVRQIYNLIAQLPLKDPQNEHNMGIFELISSINVEEWDEDYIMMIKDFTMNSTPPQGCEYKIQKSLGFYMVYEYILIHSDENMINLFLQMAHRFQKTQFLQKFITQSFTKIKQQFHCSVHIHIVLNIIRVNLINLKSQHVQIQKIIIQQLLNNPNDTQQALKDKFNLLTEINKIMEINLDLQDCKQLWRNYTISNNKSIFFEWLCKKSDSDRYWINNYIPKSIRQQFIKQIWSSSQQQYYKQMNSFEANILIEFIKYVNNEKKNIKRSYSIIKVFTLQLVGLNCLWTVFRHVEDINALQVITHALAEIYMSASQIQNQEKWVQFLVSRISTELQENFKQNNIEYIKRLILLTQILINRDEQIYSIKQIPIRIILKQYLIINPITNQQQIIKYNLSGNFYNFKKIIAQKYKLSLHKFYLSQKNKEILYDVYFKSMFQSSFQNRFQLIQKKENFSLIKNIINQHLDLFFKLLGDTRVEQMIWKIVTKLPINQSHLNEANKCNNPWQQLTDTSIYKQIYLLRVISMLSQKWWSNFVENQGRQFLLQKFNKISSSTEIQRQYLLILTSNLVSALNISTNNPKIQKIYFKTTIKSLIIMINQINLKGSFNSKTETQVTKNIFQIGYIQGQRFSASCLISLQNITNFFKLTLIDTSVQCLRSQFCENLKKLFKHLQGQEWIKLLQILLKYLFQEVKSLKNSLHLRQYFDLTSTIMNNCPRSILQEYLFGLKQNFVLKLYSLIDKQSHQLNSQKPNILLFGYLSLISSVISFQTQEKMQKISDLVLLKCLFSKTQPKCKSKETKQISFKILQILMDNNNIRHRIISILSEMHKNGKWRCRKLDDWTVVLADKLKSSTQYVGLYNLGCTCYMNSIFQQIFMIQPFRNCILQCEDPQYKTLQQNQNLLFQIKRMFINLILSEKKYYNPKNICNAFKDYEGKPINVHQQMDIDEFSGLLFDRLQKQIQNTKHQFVIKNLFSGICSNEIICKDCPHMSETQQSFLSMSLTVKNKKNIYQSFDTMIKGDRLEGDNAYYCQRCSKKVTAVKRMCLKKLPPHLLVTLKRFQFDYQTMTKVKINDYCQFPMKLNLKPYSQQYLRQKEKYEGCEDQNIQSDGYYEYQLQGIVLHIGYADSGHYYSYVRSRDQPTKWFQFNDTTVRPFNPNNIQQQAFGGEIGGFETKQKIKNAYMLIYQRVNIKNKLSQISVNTNIILKTPIYRNLLKDIEQDNIQQKIENVLFSPEYNYFCQSLLAKIHTYPQKAVIQLLKFIILAFLTIVFRSRNQYNYLQMIKKIHKNVIESQQLCTWLLVVFTNLQVYDEFIRHCPFRERRRLLASWLSQIYILCKDTKVQQQFLNTIILKIKQQNQNTFQGCIIIWKIMKAQSYYINLIDRHIVGVLIQNIIRKQSRLYGQYIEQVQPPSPIGYQNKSDKILYELSKRPKYDNEHTYVWAIITHVFQKYKNNKQKQKIILTNKELQYIFLPLNKISKILGDCKSKHQINIYCRYLCSLASHNLEFSVQLIKQICKGIRDWGFKKYRQLFILYQQLIHINDEFLVKRVEIFDKLIQAVRDNEKFTVDFNILQQWIGKLVAQNSSLQTYLIQHEKLLNYLQQIPMKKVPSNEIAYKNVVWNDDTISKLHGIKFPTTRKKYTQLAQQIQDMYQHLREHKIIHENIWYSGQEITQENLKEHESIAYFDVKNQVQYEKTVIEQIFVGKLRLCINIERYLWVWYDDDKLADIKMANKKNNDECSNSSRTTQMAPQEEEDLFDQN